MSASAKKYNLSEYPEPIEDILKVEKFYSDQLNTILLDPKKHDQVHFFHQLCKLIKPSGKLTYSQI